MATWQVHVSTFVLHGCRGPFFSTLSPNPSTPTLTPTWHLACRAQAGPNFAAMLEDSEVWGSLKTVIDEFRARMGVVWRSLEAGSRHSLDIEMMATQMGFNDYYSEDGMGK